MLFPLDYQSDESYNIGDLVLVPFRNKKVTGIIWEIVKTTNVKNIKEIIPNSDFSCSINCNIIELINKASKYYLTELGSFAKLVLPVDVNEAPIKIAKQDFISNSTLPNLSVEQNHALNKVNKSNKPVVIKGVTGSGKSEVYFYAIETEMQKGNQALIMLPEIALSQQIIERFSERFGIEVAVWNSKITKAQKKRILRGIIKGEIKIVIGARSALFLPYKKLGIIVVDEEHDPSYKQDQGILYHARDMAVLRSSIDKCKILLVSATPSIESLYNVKNGKYDLVELKSRYNNATLPDVKIVDMKKQSLAKNCWLSKPVITAIENNIKKKEQTLIFLNRRGYAPLMICKNCEYRFYCKSCSSSMVVHKSNQRLECHHCGYLSVIPTSCPECNEEESLTLCGPGIERIEEEVKRYFPDQNIFLASKEQISSQEQVQNLLKNMESNNIDILIGTQITTKGYHFPNLTLVVVVDVDSGFFGDDLRASERTFQLLKQVGGRAGREEKKGTVLLQTYCKNHKMVKALANNEEEIFIEEEISSRNISHMPPFTKMASLVISGNNQANTFETAKYFVKIAPKSEAKILGPAEAMILKKAGKYRYKILIIANRNFNLQKYLKLWKETANIHSSYQLKIDIDPHHFV